MTLSALTFVKLSVLCLGLFNVALTLRPRPRPSPPSAARPRQIHLQHDPALRLLHLDTPASIAGPVRLLTEETAHYAVAGPLADAEWASLVPAANHGLVIVDDPEPGPPRAYAVTMFHTLHCLDRIRRAIVDGADQPDVVAGDAGLLTGAGSGAKVAAQARYHVHHCLNYVRQMVLCAANTRLNPINHVFSSGGRATDGIGLTYTCRDWSKVYDAFEANNALNRTMAWAA